MLSGAEEQQEGQRSRVVSGSWSTDRKGRSCELAKFVVARRKDSELDGGAVMQLAELDVAAPPDLVIQSPKSAAPA